MAVKKLIVKLMMMMTMFVWLNCNTLYIYTCCVIIVIVMMMRVQPNVEELDRSVNELKKVLMDAKLKAKEPSGSAVMGATPPTTSRNVTPDKSSNFSPVVRPDVRRLKSEDEKSDSSFGLVVVVIVLC